MVPQLPKLIEAHRLRLPSAAGWDYRDYSDLFNVGEALFTGSKDLGRFVSVDAYPDVWARLQLFADGLLDSNHPLAERTKGEFRGFLALMALRDRKNLNVRAVEVDFTAKRNNQFFSTADGMRPAGQRLCDDTGWDKLNLISLNNQVVGITSPMTLLCPTDGAHLVALSRVPWCFDGQRFVDPVGRLTADDAVGVAAWIGYLIDKFGKHPSPFGAVGAQWRNELLKHLKDFKESLDARRSPDGVVAPPPSLAANGLPINTGCAAYLAKPLKRAPIGIESSMAVIKSQRQPEPPKRLLLIDPALGKKLGRPDSEVMVLDGYSLDDIRSIPLGTIRSKIGNNIDLPAQMEWRRPEDFFTNKLVIIRESPNAFPGTLQCDGQSAIAAKYNGAPILPLRSDLLPYLTPTFIQENAFFREAPNGIEFGIRLPLQHEGGVEVSCVYTAVQAGATGAEKGQRTIHYETNGVPVLELWPDFAHPKWHLYFVYWDNHDEDTIYARPYDESSFLSFKEHRPDGRREREVFELRVPPEFLSCYIPERGMDGSSRDVEAGVLMPSLRPLRVESSASFKVGVDFGTSNTNAYMKKGDGTPMPLLLESSTLAVTPPLSSDRYASLYRYFIPSGSETSPFLSFFSQRPNVPEGTKHPIRHGHILFYNEQYNDLDVERDRVKTNLKWRDEYKSSMEAYIKQVCLHAAAEAFKQGATRIQWYYSLPTAFPVHRQETLQTIWEAIITWISQDLGIPCDRPKRQTESVVAAKFFATLPRSTRVFPRAGAIFIDIGGGTSDISIWQNDTLLLQHSLRFAGDQIIQLPLYAHRGRALAAIPDDVVPAGRIAALERVRDARVFYAKTDALFRGYGAAIFAWLPKAPDANQDLKRLIDHVRLGLAGLFYYSGLMLRHLGSDAVPKDKRYSAPSDNALPGVNIGGNGSKLFQWAGRGSYRDDSQINELFREMLLRGAGWKGSAGQLKTTLTPQPKAEAAHGLVADYDLRDVDQLDEEAFNSVVAGEEYMSDGVLRSITSLLTREVLASKVSVAGLPSIDQFLDVYGGFASKATWNLEPIRGRDAMLRSVRNALDEWMAQQGKCDAREIDLQPPFVVALRQLLIEFMGEPA